MHACLPCSVLSLHRYLVVFQSMVADVIGIDVYGSVIDRSICQVRKFMRTWFFPAGKEPIDLLVRGPQPDMLLGPGARFVEVEGSQERFRAGMSFAHVRTPPKPRSRMKGKTCTSPKH